MDDWQAEGTGTLQRVLKLVQSTSRVLPGESLRVLNVLLKGNLR